MEKLFGVYAVTCIDNNKRYIGSSINLYRRKAQHFYDMRHNKHGNPRLQAEFNLYGERAFYFSILETVKNKFCLLEREQYWIDLLHPEYNAELKAGYSIEHVHNPEVRKKISVSVAKLWQNAEYKENFIRKRRGVSVPKLRGRIVSEETRQKIKVAGSGEKNHNYGKPRCQSFLDKMRKTYDGAISPDGVVYSPIIGLKAFCSVHGLDSGQMSRVLNGSAKSHKGWIKV